MQGIVQRIIGDLTDDNLPRFYAEDPMITRHTLMMYDLKNPLCYNAAPGVVVPSGAVFKNLVKNGIDAIMNGGNCTYDGKGIKLNSGGNIIKMGNGPEYDLGTLGISRFVASAWVMFPSGAEENNSAYQKIFFKYTTTTPSAYQFGIDTGVNGKTPRGGVHDGGTAVVTRAVTSESAFGVVQHLAVGVDAGGLSFYRDGVKQASSIPTVGPIPARTDIPLVVGGWAKGTIYRWSMENLQASGQTVAQFVAAEYARAVGRFV